MRISIDWLKEFVSIKEDPAGLADMLSMLGLEAERYMIFHSYPELLSGKWQQPKSIPMLIG